MAEEKEYAGIDVSKSWLDVAILPTEEDWRIENTEKGIGNLIRMGGSIARSDCGGSHRWI